MTSEIDVINHGLRCVGARAISSISEVTPGGALASDILAIERDAELRDHLWNFAATRVRLGKLPIIPRYEFSFGYRLPSDWVRTVSVCDNDAGSGQAVYKQEGVLTEELVANGNFDNSTIWATGTGWSIGSGVATKVAGVASNLTQPVALVAGARYRVCYLIAGMSTGTLTASFTGGTAVTGQARTADGYYAEELVAVISNNVLTLAASNTFNGTVDTVSVIRMDGEALPAIISSSEAIFMKYVRRVKDPNQWDASFAYLMGLKLGKRFALGLANSTTYFQLLDADMKTAYRQARSTDAMEDYPDAFPDGDWITSRGSTGRDPFDNSWARR